MKKILIIIAIIFGITGFTHVKAATEKTIINNLVLEDKNKSTEANTKVTSESKISANSIKDYWCFETSRSTVTQECVDGSEITTTTITYRCSWTPGAGVAVKYYFF